MQLPEKHGSKRLSTRRVVCVQFKRTFLLTLPARFVESVKLQRPPLKATYEQGTCRTSSGGVFVSSPANALLATPIMKMSHANWTCMFRFRDHEGPFAAPNGPNMEGRSHFRATLAGLACTMIDKCLGRC